MCADGNRTKGNTTEHFLKKAEVRIRGMWNGTKNMMHFEPPVELDVFAEAIFCPRNRIPIKTGRLALHGPWVTNAL